MLKRRQCYIEKGDNMSRVYKVGIRIEAVGIGPEEPSDEKFSEITETTFKEMSKELAKKFKMSFEIDFHYETWIGETYGEIAD